MRFPHALLTVSLAASTLNGVFCSSVSASESLIYADPVGATLPWGIHIASGSESTTSMTIMWSTRLFTKSVVTFSADGQNTQQVLGEEIPFSDSNNVQTLHRAYLTELLPATNYSYSVGSGLSNETSAIYSFMTPPTIEWFPTVAVFGDMGISSNALATLPWLLADAKDGKLDAVVHIGDIAYNLESNNGATGDSWMVQMTPLFASFPYFLCPGNHEDANDFYQYRMRLGAIMPPADSPSRGGNGTFSSFNLGLIHFALVSSEVYMSVQPHSAFLAIEQAQWLERDLAAVNRSVTPFVVLGLHQPFYCSPNDDQDDCHQILSVVRIGLEKIIYDGGVDMVFGAHEHSYGEKTQHVELSAPH